MGIFFITLSTTMMKIVFIALCLFALADDTKSNCTTVATIPASCTGTQNTADPNEWVTVENLGAGANACYSVTFDDGFDSSEDVYVLATRNGDDGVPASNAAVTTTGFTNTTVIGCVSLTASQEEDDTDYLCSSQTATAYYTVASNAGANATTIDIYTGYAEGTVSDCTASYVSSSGSSIWLWVVIGLVVVVIVVVILAAVGGFLYMKKKKNSYQLYEDA